MAKKLEKSEEAEKKEKQPGEGGCQTRPLDLKVSEIH